MRRVVLMLATMALAIMLAGGVAQAIINGVPDKGANAHPYVGALVTVPPSGEFKGQRIPVCSGTLISAKVFLTAGHCTDFLTKKDLPTYVSFDPTYEPGASKVIKATPYTHPRFCSPNPEDKVDCGATESSYTEAMLSRELRYDVGVAVLEKPVRMATYGALPEGWSGRHPQGGPTPHHRGLRRETATKKSTANRRCGHSWSSWATVTGPPLGSSTQKTPK